MAFKLAIDNKLRVNVRGKIAGTTPAQDVRINFHLVMDRLEQQEINEAMHSGSPIADFLVEHTHGWESQRLVLNEDGQPAAYTPDALRELLKVPGMAVWIWQAYMRDVGVQEKN